MNRLACQLATLFMLTLSSFWVSAKPPECTNANAWPAAMAFTHLKNGGIVSNDELDFKKTLVTRLASEKIGKDLYRQIHLVRFVRTSGEPVEAITVNDASSKECSMSGVDVYLITKRFGDYSKQH
jgi:hypothetical protein